MEFRAFRGRQIYPWESSQCLLTQALCNPDGCPLGLLSLREAEGAGGKAAPGAGGTGAGH